MSKCANKKCEDCDYTPKDDGICIERPEVFAKRKNEKREPLPYKDWYEGSLEQAFDRSRQSRPVSRGTRHG